MFKSRERPAKMPPVALTRLARIKAGTTPAARDIYLGPTKATNRDGGQRAGANQQLKGRRFGIRN